jgi:ribonucleoside-triphosphate reductase
LNKSLELLSEITVHMKYAKYLPEKKRRESWIEICKRNMNMHINKYPSLKSEIEQVYNNYVMTKKILPSMRSMQFAGKPIELSPNRLFNCAYMPIDNIRSMSELMFLLLGGSGVGFSVQKMHIDKLPEIRKPTRNRRYVVNDSIEGWADAVKVLLKAYFEGKSNPIFDFSDIREKGAPLITSGGKAPGAEPLKECLFNLKKILDRKKDGEKLTTLEVHDMCCYIADSVLAGGIRRAALISFFDIDDEPMLTCKFGAWWELNPQRARANNSAVVVRHKVKEVDFFNLWEKVKASGSGEPGIVFTNNPEVLGNPCFEISLKPYQFCNLTEINVSDIGSQEEFNNRAKAASFIGTLQASYTNFHYLRDIWKKTTEHDALLGVSMTGIASNNVFNFDIKKAANVVMQENERVAGIISINKAARTTCVKPAGTTSLVLGCSSGIHSWHSPFYIRRIRVGKNESIYNYLLKNNPSMVEDEFFKPNSQAVISVPIKAPEGASFRNESALKLLKRVKKLSKDWIVSGYRKGDNHHNISATISVKDSEWDKVGKWMWENTDYYNGLSVLPYDGGTYKQAPFEEITESEYSKLVKAIKPIDLMKVVELTDNTDLSGELACAGGACEWTGN